MAKNSKGRRKPRQARATKADKVETRSAGDKQYKLPAGSKIAHHLANAEGWEAKLADLKASVKKVYEAASADGVTKTLLKDLMALKAGDPVAARQALEAYGIGLKVIGAQFQLHIFDTMYESDVAQAKAEARAAAKAGRSPECRFSEGSEAHEAYMAEYMDVQSTMVPSSETMDEDTRKGSIAAGKASREAAAAH